MSWVKWVIAAPLFVLTFTSPCQGDYALRWQLGPGYRVIQCVNGECPIPRPLGDFDGDGRTEVVGSGLNGTVRIRDALTGQLEYELSLGWSGFVTALDLNSDATPEIVLWGASGSDGNLAVIDYFTEGNGSQESTGGSYVLNWTNTVDGIFLTYHYQPLPDRFGDFDGDGRLELVVTRDGTNDLRIVDALSGQLEFEATIPFEFSAIPFPYDLDLDGTPELLLHNYGSDFAMIDYVGPSAGIPLHMLQYERTPAAIRPNPFNPSATIDYTIPRNGAASLVVYDVSGRLIRSLVEGKIDAGKQSVTWDGRDNWGQVLPSGTYFYSLSLDGQLLDKGKAVILK